MLVSKILELLDKTFSHVLHSSGHHDKVVVPHLCKPFIAEDDVDKTCTVDGWVRVDWPGNLLDTRHDGSLLFLVSSNDGEDSSSFTVETEILSKGLEEHDVVGMFSEESECVGILVEVATSKSLVSVIETAEEVLSLDNLKDRLPLCLSWVDTSWVVSTRVEEDE